MEIQIIEVDDGEAVEFYFDNAVAAEAFDDAARLEGALVRKYSGEVYSNSEAAFEDWLQR